MRTQSMEAIVLKTYDVGEADRFCILFTRERGRIAARAAGVRKILSRKAAALMPFQHISVDIRESGGRCVISAAQRLSISPDHAQTLQSFTIASEGIEIFSHFIHGEQPLPDIFDALLRFLRACHDEHVMMSLSKHESRTTLLAFQIRLLHLLGILPETFPGLSELEHAFLCAARTGQWHACGDVPRAVSALSRAIDLLLCEHCPQPLKAGAVVKTMCGV